MFLIFKCLFIYRTCIFPFMFCIFFCLYSFIYFSYLWSQFQLMLILCLSCIADFFQFRVCLLLVYGIMLFLSLILLDKIIFNFFDMFAAAAAKQLQSCLTLWDPIGGSPPGSPVPGILQVRTLEWVAISFSSAWKWKVKGNLLSHVQLLATPWTVAYQAPPSMEFARQEYWSGVPLPSPSDMFSQWYIKGSVSSNYPVQVAAYLKFSKDNVFPSSQPVGLHHPSLIEWLGRRFKFQYLSI